jgi:hypothetical protein
MTTASIRPFSENGIKQLAKKLSREQNIPHHLALDAASRQAGFENFVHAKRQLPASRAALGFPVYLSIHWFTPRVRKDEPKPSGPRWGRELLCVHLSRALPEIVAKHRVGRARGLHGFRMEYEDHLEHRTNVEGQAEARRRLLAAARSLRFMEATGLQPVSTRKYDAISQILTTLPGRDHDSDWFDPDTEAYVCLDEPYARAVGGKSAECAQWLQSRSLLHMVVPDWEGIYYAGQCTPRLVSPDGALLQRVAVALADVQPVIEPEQWPHETGRYNDEFVSPKREADGRPRRRRPGPSWGEHKGATPYGGDIGIPSRWRPTKAMPFELHQQLGPLMQGLAAVGFSSRVNAKLITARSELEDWSIMEHRDQLGDAVYDIYYGGPRAIYGSTDAERLEMLEMARAIVERGYDDCKPRRTLLATFDAAIGEMETTVAKRAN